MSTAGIRFAAATAAITLLLACSPDAQPAPPTLTTDSAGTLITTTDATGRDAGAICSLAEAPETRIASPSSGEWTLFQVEDLDRMEDGHLVVVNRGSRQLLMFGRDGEFVRSVGREGEGPGEFVDPVELGFVGDSIVVWDWGSGRLVLFGPDGSHGRSVRLQPPVVNPTGYTGMLGEQGIAVANHDVPSFHRELTPQFLQVLRYAWNGVLLDTLVTLPYGELGRDPETRRLSRPLFESRGVFSTHDGLLYTSDGETPEVRVRRGQRLERILRWDPGDLSVREEDVEAYKAAQLEGAGDRAPAVRRRLDGLPVKDAFPAVREIQIDPQEGIWIRTFARPGATANEWLGFAETGGFICSLSVPRSLKVFRFDDGAVVGVHRDEMDIESVDVWPFAFPG